jgi:hypothetical protein
MRETYCELEPTEAAAPTESPFIVREPSAGTSSASSTSRGQETETPAPVERPPEAARTRDGEADPPAAAT